MIRVTAKDLSREERQLLLRAAHFCLDKMVTLKLKQSCTISIKVGRMDPEIVKQRYIAMMECSTKDGKKRFDVSLDLTTNATARKPQRKLKKLMIAMFHELVHVKQYLNNEIYDYVDGNVKYKGEVYQGVWDKAKDNPTMHKLGLLPDSEDEHYYNQPWEIEANGREGGFWIMFNKLLVAEERAKKDVSQKY